MDIAKSKIDNVVVKFKYKIRVKNEGQIPGYAKEITDFIPNGLRFVPGDNPEWTDLGDGRVTTNQLANTLLVPGEEPKTVEIVLTWINGVNNFGLKSNTAEITVDYNESDTPDIDSTPSNFIPEEDDIDDAPVQISIRTGSMINATYIYIGAAVLVILTTGIILIKKYVL